MYRRWRLRNIQVQLLHQNCGHGRPMKLKTIWPEDGAKVLKVLGMTEATVKADVASLKDWLRKQPHLGPLSGVNEDKWLKNYLMLNKNSVERCKANLDVYFTLRWIMPEVFQDRDMKCDTMNRSFDNTCIAFMPGLTAEGHRVVVYSHFTPDPTDFVLQDMARRLLAIADLGLCEGVDRAGDIIIMDLLNTRVSHLAKYSLNMVRNMFQYAWKAYPERVAAIHIVNPPHVMEMALNIFRPFVKQKIFDRIQIHSNIECLKEHISLDLLPSDYGGHGPSCKEMNKAWQNKMIDCRDLLNTVASHKSNESLRPDVRKHVDSWTTDLGMNGSFRKLSLD